VEAALALDVADRPPVCAWGHNYDLEWDPATLARATAERTLRLEFDFVKLQIRATCFAEALGSEYRYSGDPSKEPVLVKQVVVEPEDWTKVPRVGATTSPLDEQVRCLRQTVARVGADTPVIQTLFSPITVAGFLVNRDQARMLDDLRRRPGLVRPALERIAGAIADFGRASIEAGAGGVFYAITNYGSADAMALAEYEELLLPLDRQVLDACSGGWFNMLHLCGPRQHFELAERLPVHCVNWQLQDPGNPGLAEGRGRSGKAVAGGLHRHSPIADGTPEQVREQAAAALQDSAGRGHLLTPGCSVSPWPAGDEANFRALVRAASERRYDA
jgi:uroporphyrinogen decarboxylase